MSDLETRAFDLPENAVIDSLVPSPNAAGLAYLVRNGQGTALVLNGHDQLPYEAVAGVTFAPDSQSVAYAALRQSSWYVVFNDAEHGPYADVGTTSPVVSPDSRRVAYAARLKSGGWAAHLDGVRIGAPCEGFAPGGLLFAPDSQALAWVIKAGDSWKVMVDGQERREHPGIIERSLAVSPNAKRLAYIAAERRKRLFRRETSVARLMIDGEAGPAWEYDASSGRNGISDEIVFSPDSRRIAYAIARDGRWRWIVDGEDQPEVDGFVSGWAADPNWKRFPDYGKLCCRKGTLAFSPDSRRFAYAGRDGGDCIMALDGRPQRAHAAVLNAPIVFSPDSKRVAYGAEDDDGMQFVQLDDESLSLHRGLCGSPSFSPDSKQLAYVARDSPQDFRLVVGSRSWALAGGPVVGSRIVWDDDRRLHLLTARDRRVTVARYRTS